MNQQGMQKWPNHSSSYQEESEVKIKDVIDKTFSAANHLSVAGTLLLCRHPPSQAKRKR